MCRDRPRSCCCWNLKKTTVTFWGYVNQKTGQDLDTKNREGRFPKEGGKQKKVKTEASWITLWITSWIILTWLTVRSPRSWSRMPSRWWMRWNVWRRNPSWRKSFWNLRRSERVLEKSWCFDVFCLNWYDEQSCLFMVCSWFVQTLGASS